MYRETLNPVLQEFALYFLPLFQNLQRPKSMKLLKRSSAESTRVLKQANELGYFFRYIPDEILVPSVIQYFQDRNMWYQPIH